MAGFASDPELLHQRSTVDQITLEIGKTLCSFLMIPEDDFDMEMSLEEMGIDSLVSIEIRNWVVATVGGDISVLEVTNTGTVSRLGVLAVASLKKKFLVVAHARFLLLLGITF